LRFDKDLIGSLSTPTLFDVAWRPLFRPARRDDHWGCAVDLADYGEGLPEAIRKRTDWRACIGVEPIGEITAPAWDGSDKRLEELYLASGKAFNEAAVADVL
jgi:hypothetical protein